MATVTTSKQFSLNLSDWWKGLILAVGTPVVAIIIDSLQKGELNFNWRLIGITALSAFLSYMVKNFLTPPAVVIKDVSNETVESVKQGESTAKITKS